MIQGVIETASDCSSAQKVIAHAAGYHELGHVGEQMEVLRKVTVLGLETIRKKESQKQILGRAQKFGPGSKLSGQFLLGSTCCRLTKFPHGGDGPLFSSRDGRNILFLSGVSFRCFFLIGIIIAG